MPSKDGATGGCARARKRWFEVENIGRYHCVGSFEGVVYVGDGVWDARAARNLGFPFIGISPEPGKAARLHAEGACRVFGDYLDAAAFMTAVDEAWDLAPPAH